MYVKWDETLDIKVDAIWDVKHDTNIGATLGAMLVANLDAKKTSTKME